MTESSLTSVVTRQSDGLSGTDKELYLDLKDSSKKSEGLQSTFEDWELSYLEVQESEVENSDSFEPL